MKYYNSVLLTALAVVMATHTIKNVSAGECVQAMLDTW